MAKQNGRPWAAGMLGVLEMAAAVRRATTGRGAGGGTSSARAQDTVRSVECAGPSTVVFDPTLTDYDFGPHHPMSPIRVDLTMQLAHELGVTATDGQSRLRVVPAPMADLDRIATVHDAALIEAVQRAGRTGAAELQVGLGSDDNPVFLGMHEAAAHVVGASLEAFRQVWSGESLHAANITGGLHHAMPNRASGFCVYNDVAIGMR